MLDFDLRDTVAGQQIYDEAMQVGILKDARDMVIEALMERFVSVSPEIRESVYSVGDHEILKKLLKYAIRSPHMEDFGKILAKVLSPKTGNVAGASG